MDETHIVFGQRRRCAQEVVIPSAEVSDPVSAWPTPPSAVGIGRACVDSCQLLEDGSVRPQGSAPSTTEAKLARGRQASLLGSAMGNPPNASADTVGASTLAPLMRCRMWQIPMRAVRSACQQSVTSERFSVPWRLICAPGVKTGFAGPVNILTVSDASHRSSQRVTCATNPSESQELGARNLGG